MFAMPFCIRAQLPLYARPPPLSRHRPGEAPRKSPASAAATSATCQPVRRFCPRPPGLRRAMRMSADGPLTGHGVGCVLARPGLRGRAAGENAARIRHVPDFERRPVRRRAGRETDAARFRRGNPPRPCDPGARCLRPRSRSRTPRRRPWLKPQVEVRCERRGSPGKGRHAQQKLCTKRVAQRPVSAPEQCRLHA
jgi:hypothetical protein